MAHLKPKVGQHYWIRQEGSDLNPVVKVLVLQLSPPEEDGECFVQLKGLGPRPITVSARYLYRSQRTALKAAIKDFQKRIEELAEMSKAITMALEELTHYQKITMGQLQKLGTTPVTSVRKKKIPFRVLDGGRVKENLVPLK